MLGLRTSSYLQAKRVLLAAEHVYAQVPPLVDCRWASVVSTDQAYRCAQAAGQVLRGGALAALNPLGSAGPGPVYGKVDDLMYFTDTGWQEAKVGRVSQQSAPAGAH